MNRSIRLIIFFFALFSPLTAWSENWMVKKAVDATGDWNKGIIMGREALFSDKNKINSQVSIDIPRSGNYQLFAYAYHNLKRHSPFILIEMKDSQGNKHRGYFFLEHQWYLDKDASGRWLMHSFTMEPDLYLPKGEATLNFGASARVSEWNMHDAPMEGIVAIESFILAPVLDGQAPVGMAPIEPESGFGDWDYTAYSGEDGVGEISSPSKEGVSNLTVDIPQAREYTGIISLRAPQGSTLELIFEAPDSTTPKVTLEVKASPYWQTQSFGPLILKKGRYNLVFKNLPTDKITPRLSIDYLLLLPS